MTPYRPFRTVLFLVAACCLSGCCGPASAQDTLSPGATASDLAAEVLRKADSDDLGDWTRSVLDRALKRAGDMARQTESSSTGRFAAPLPAERQAGRIAEVADERGGPAELLIFTSLSVPAASWRQWARAAARSGAPLLLRGVGAEGLADTAKQVGTRLGGDDAGVAIDPRLFRLFGIERVPAVVVVPGGVPPCESRGCASDAAPPHDRVTGNIGLAAALEAVAAEGNAGREAAKAHLERMRGDGR